MVMYKIDRRGRGAKNRSLGQIRKSLKNSSIFVVLKAIILATGLDKNFFTNYHVVSKISFHLSCTKVNYKLNSYLPIKES